MALPARRYRLGAILVSSIAALVLISAGSVLAVQFLSSRHVLSELAGYVTESAISRLESDIKNHLNPAEELVRYVATEITSGRARIEDNNNLAGLLTGSLAAAPQVGSVLVVDESLFVSRIIRNFRNQTYVLDRPDWQALPGAKESIEEARKRGKLFWGDLLYSPRTGRSFLNVRMPMFNNNTMIGMVAASVSVNELSALIKVLGKDGVSVPFILYGDDHVLAHRQLKGLNVGRSVQNPLVKAQDMDDPVIASLAKAVPMDARFFPADDRTEIRKLEAGGVAYMIVTRAINGYGDKPLIAGTYTKLEVVRSTFRPFYIAALIGLCILALAMLGAVFIASRLARPIAAASKTAQAIGELDFDRMAPMACSSIAEIDDLAGSFNKMLIGLQTFGRYVPKSLVRKLVSGGHHGAGSEERELTVMFTDMRSFTAMCEGKSANQVAEFINEHLTMLSECIEAEGGTIDKYIGDAVMAFWGAPDESANSAERACRAALRMAEMVAHQNELRMKQGLAPVGVRVGIHTGPLVVGDIGSPSRINYTVVGDVVNITQRLENLGKEIDNSAETVILLSSDTRSRLPEGFETHAEGAFQLKGRSQKVDVYRLTGAV